MGYDRTVCRAYSRNTQSIRIDIKEKTLYESLLIIREIYFLAYRASKITALTTITTLFAATNAARSDEENLDPPIKQDIEDILKAQNIDIKLPIDVGSQDEYVQLYNVAFNNISSPNQAFVALANTCRFFNRIQEHTKGLAELNQQTNDLINGMQRHELIKIPESLVNIIQ